MAYYPKDAAAVQRLHEQIEALGIPLVLMRTFIQLIGAITVQVEDEFTSRKVIATVHPNQQQYPGQKLYFVNVEGYIHIVPHVVEDEYVFLKTIIPSRKATRDFEKEGEQNETR